MIRIFTQQTDTLKKIEKNKTNVDNNFERQKQQTRKAISQ